MNLKYKYLTMLTKTRALLIFWDTVWEKKICRVQKALKPQEEAHTAHA